MRVFSGLCFLCQSKAQKEVSHLWVPSARAFNSQNVSTVRANPLFYSLQIKVSILLEGKICRDVPQGRTKGRVANVNVWGDGECDNRKKVKGCGGGRNSGKRPRALFEEEVLIVKRQEV